MHTDLFWDLREGGSNFGIVTSFLYKAHPVPTVLSGLVVYRHDQAAAVLRCYRDAMAYAPEELMVSDGLLSTPDGTPAVGVMTSHFGNSADGERVLNPLCTFGSLIMDTAQPIPFPAMQKLADEANPDQTHNYWRSTFLREPMHASSLLDWRDRSLATAQAESQLCRQERG
jgi:hypothetical protein